MKKPSSKIREEIARLQDQLRQAETREAERIGRIALRAGLGEIDIDEAALLTGFEELAQRFRGNEEKPSGKKSHAGRKGAVPGTAPIQAGAPASGNSEA